VESSDPSARFTGLRATTRKPWTRINRVLYVKLPCPSVSTSYSKVLSDARIIPLWVEA